MFLKCVLEVKLETAELPIDCHSTVQDWHKSLLFSSNVTDKTKHSVHFWADDILYVNQVTIMLGLTLLTLYISFDILCFPFHVTSLFIFVSFV